MKLKELLFFSENLIIIHLRKDEECIRKNLVKNNEGKETE